MPPTATTVDTAISPSSIDSLGTGSWSGFSPTSWLSKLDSRNDSILFDPPSACGTPTYPARMDPIASTMSGIAMDGGAS